MTVSRDNPTYFFSKVDRRVDGSIFHAKFELIVKSFEKDYEYSKYFKERFSLEGYWGDVYNSTIYLNWQCGRNAANVNWRFDKVEAGHHLVLSTCIDKSYQPIIDFISELDNDSVAQALLDRLHEVLRKISQAA
jgi:hypothetical protein